jgi:hypothetical protein
MSTESQKNPPDPYEALKRGELLAILVAQALAPYFVLNMFESRETLGGRLDLLEIGCSPGN